MDRRIVTISKDGQTITIHPNYREQPSPGAGSKFMVFPSEDTLLSAIADLKVYAEHVGLTDENIQDTIKASREGRGNK